jgi:hypothetical protein
MSLKTLGQMNPQCGMLLPSNSRSNTVRQSYFHQNTMHCIKYMKRQTKIDTTVKAVKETLQQSPNAICED